MFVPEVQKHFHLENEKNNTTLLCGSASINHR